MEMRPNTRGTFCPLCDEWLEYVDWPTGLPRPAEDSRVLYDPVKVVEAVNVENEAMLREHMAGHTAGVMLHGE